MFFLHALGDHERFQHVVDAALVAIALALEVLDDVLIQPNRNALLFRRRLHGLGHPKPLGI